MKDPRRMLSPRVAESFEQSPAFTAAMEHSSVIPATWGDLASRIVEAGLVEPDIDAVCGYLVIDREDLASTHLALESSHDLSFLRVKLSEDSEKRFVETHGPVANEFGTYVDERLKGWEVEDSEEQAKEIQRQLDALGNDRATTLSDSTALLCLKRDALYDGAMVSLPEFLKAIFSDFEGQPFFTPQELGDSVGAMLDGIVRSYVIRDTSTVRVEDVILGRDQIRDFTLDTKYRFNRKARESAEEKWEALRPFVVAPEPTDYLLIEKV